MIEALHLHKAFGDHVVLRDLDLVVPEGRFLALIGPNGAGKTTLVRILSTLSRPTAGHCRLAGLDPQRHSVEVRRRIGLVSHQTLLYADLSAEENLRFYARLYDLPDPESRIDELLNRVGLATRRSELVRTFSRGMQQRLAIARAILHDPPILLLDEPDTGLDLHAADRLREILEELATRARTVLMTTHNMSRALQMAAQVAILTGGQIAYQSSTRGLDEESLRAHYEQATRQGL